METSLDTSQEELLRILSEKGTLKAQQVEEARTAVAGGKHIYDALVGGKLVPEEKFTEAFAAVVGYPYVDLRRESIPRDLLLLIPESTAREHMIVAYKQTPEQILVAMVDPSDRQIVEFLHKKVNKEVAVAVASQSSLRTGLNQYQQSLDTELQDLMRDTGSVTVRDNDDLSKAAEDLPVIRTVDLILRHAIRQNASDIHIEPTETEMLVRYRLDGILHTVLTLPRNFLSGVVARLKVLSNLKIDEHRLPQDGRFKIEGEDYKIAFRVSILPVYDGEKVVMRLLDESGKGLTLDVLGMGDRLLEIFRRNIAKPNGMVLVTGPTGSGKTTTLYAAMHELNTPDVNISTIEDPIEYRMPKINQTQVNPNIGLTFSNGLRALVRQDPDIIMVGEIRDEETAGLAVNAALTGHLVLSTLHTNSAAGALPRLLDMNVEAFLVATTTNLLLAQRLVRKLCPECRREVKLESAVVDDLKKTMDVDALLQVLKREKAVAESATWDTVTVYEPVGCSLCTGGYKGRLGIYEAIEVTDELRVLVTPTRTAQELQEAARKQQNMITMIEDGFIKIVTGVTSLEEVVRVAKE